MEMINTFEDFTPEAFYEFLATLPEEFQFGQDCDNPDDGPAKIPWACRCPIATFLTVRHLSEHGDERWLVSPMTIDLARATDDYPIKRMRPEEWMKEFMREMDTAIGFPGDHDMWRSRATAERALVVLKRVLWPERVV